MIHDLLERKFTHIGARLELTDRSGGHGDVLMNTENQAQAMRTVAFLD